MAGLQLVLGFLVAVAAAVLVLMLLEAGVIKEARAHLARRRARRRDHDGPPTSPDPFPPASIGYVTTPLKPAGRVSLAGVEHAAKSEFGYIEPGTRVEVIGNDGGVFIVRPEV